MMQSYIEKCIKKFGIAPVRRRSTIGELLCTSSAGSEPAPNCKFSVPELIGALQWVANTCRPDVALSVNVLAQHASGQMTKMLWSDIQRVFEYLYFTKHIGVYADGAKEEMWSRTYGEVKKRELSIFCDAAFANRRGYRSTSASITYLGAFAINWSSKAQKLVSKSTWEAEYVSASDAISQELDIRGYLGSWLDSCKKIYVDNEAVCTLALDPQQVRAQSVHIMLRCVRVAEQKRFLRHCSGVSQRADALTKTNVSRTILMNAL